MAGFDALLIRRYAEFKNLVPKPESIRSKFPLVDAEHRSGAEYSYPVQTTLAGGVTFSNAPTSSATLNTPVDATYQNALVTAPDVYMSARPNQAQYMRSLEAAQNGSAGAYFKCIDKAVKDCIDSHENALDISYLHGSGTASALADDIGVVASAAGTNLGTAGYLTRISTATWSEGVWNTLIGQQVDIYGSNGTTVVETNVTVVAINDETTNKIELFKSGSAVTLASGNRIVLKGSLANQMYGVGALLRNTGTLFNVSGYFWKARSFDAGGAALTSAKFLQACARLQAAGQEKGLTAFCHPLQYNDIVVEANDKVKFNDKSVKVEIGSNSVMFHTGCGPIELMPVTTQKQGACYVVSNEDVVSVGSSMVKLVGADGSCEIVQRVSGTTAFEVQSMSSCAPLLRKPAQSMLITNIVPGGATIGV